MLRWEFVSVTIGAVIALIATTTVITATTTNTNFADITPIDYVYWCFYMTTLVKSTPQW